MFNNINEELFNRNKMALLRKININQEVKRYILLDPAISDELTTSYSGSINRCPVPISHPDMSVQSRPYLVEVKDDENGKALLDLSLRLAISETTRDKADPKRLRSMCAWLTSFDSIDLLSEKLALKSIIRVAEKEKVLFRYYDPRVMDLLLEVVDPEQFSNGLHQLSGWFWLSRKAELQSYPLIVAKTNAPLWYLTKNQQVKLSRVSWINKCMDKQYVYPSICKNRMSVAELNELFEFIKDKYAITKQDDAITYAHYALTVKRTFNQHAEITRVLDNFDQDNELLSVLLNSISQSIWNQITTDF